MFSTQTRETQLPDYAAGGAFGMAAATDIGTVRKLNEDAYYFSNTHQFFIVCDGMGGHNSGALASRIAAKTLQHVLTHSENIEIEKLCEDIEEKLPYHALRLIAGVRLANRRIVMEAAANPTHRGMGSTIVAAIYHEGWLYSVNVGDSRIYRLRQNQLELLTRDHSWINELLEDREISEAEVQKFRKKNVLTRALGIYPTVKIDLRIENTQERDLYLLCSDGLHNALSAELITSVMRAEHSSLQKMAERLVSNAKKLNGSDNITAGVWFINEKSKRNLAPAVFEKTIGEESPQVLASLDRTLKSLFPKPAIRRQLPKKTLGWSMAAIVLLCLLSFLLFRIESAGPLPKPAFSSALLTQEVSTINSQSRLDLGNGQLEKAGSLVLLQVRDASYLNYLRQLDGIRILDVISTFVTDDVPVFAGDFTWAVADSNQRIIHKKDNVHLISLKAWERRSESRATRNIGNRLQEETRNARTSDSAIVYLVGSFDTLAYRNAWIFINNTRLGRLFDYLESGIQLTPGSYNISIRDGAGKILQEKNNQDVQGGKTIAVEF